MNYVEKLPARFEFGIFFGIITAAITFLIVAWLLWQIPLPYKLHSFSEHLKYWLEMNINHFLPTLFESPSNTYRNYLNDPSGGNKTWIYLFRFNISCVLAITVGGYCGYLIGKPQPAIRHIRGRKFLSGKSATLSLMRLSKRECQESGKGLTLHPSFPWHLSIDRETRHFIIYGSTGGGKTEIMKPLIQAAIKRNDRIIIYDNKGDFTEWLPYLVIIAPWDKRSHAWDIAQDCINSQDARELAARLIPPGNDPLWHQAARHILTAILIKLQRESGQTWTWNNLYKLACRPQTEILEIVNQYLPDAQHLLNSESKTTQSILINFSVNLSLIADLSNAWGNVPKEKRFSINSWLNDENDRRSILVLQGNGRYAELARAYIQGIISTLSATITSPNFTESHKRKIWFFIDEFPQLGELKNFATILETGRSKGVRVVLGTQDISQIKSIYGQDVANTWSSMIGTHIITRLNSGVTTTFLSHEVIGKKEIDRISPNQGKSDSIHREFPLVVAPEYISDSLGKNKTGISGLLLGCKDVHELHWSFTNVKKIRKSSVPADWTMPSSTTTGSPINPTKILTNVTTDIVQVAENSSTQQTKSIPKLRLRQKSKQDAAFFEMAATGTKISEAAEPFKELTNNTVGGNDESN